MELSDESIAKILCGPIVSDIVVDQSIRVDIVGDLEEGGQEFLSSTLVKGANGDGNVNVVDSLKFPSQSPLKRSAGVAFVISEKEEFVGELAQSGKRKRNTNDGDGGTIATSTGGLTTEIGLSELDEMIRQGPSTILASDPTFGKTSLGVELPPREKLVGITKICQRSKFDPGQSAETLLKNCFELNPPTVVDPKHITTSLSVNQMIQFAPSVGLEKALASCGLSEDLLVRSRPISCFGLLVLSGNLLLQVLLGLLVVIDGLLHHDTHCHL